MSRSSKLLTETVKISMNRYEAPFHGCYQKCTIPQLHERHKMINSLWLISNHFFVNIWSVEFCINIDKYISQPFTLIHMTICSWCRMTTLCNLNMVNARKISLFNGLSCNFTLVWFRPVTYTALAINSLWRSDAIWPRISRLTLPRIMACCLTPSGLCLNPCWLLTSEDLRFATFTWDPFHNDGCPSYYSS